MKRKRLSHLFPDRGNYKTGRTYFIRFIFVLFQYIQLAVHEKSSYAKERVYIETTKTTAATATTTKRTLGNMCFNQVALKPK